MKESVSSNPGPKILIDFVAPLLLALLMAWVYIGFFHSDPRIDGTARVLLWAMKIGYPPAALLVLMAYHLWRTKRLSGMSIIAALAGMVVALLLAYPIASYIYARSFLKDVGMYHPYLQLAPREIHLRDSNEGHPFRIFCLGGSTTEFRDQSGRGWPERLEGHLRKARPDRAIEVYNAGRQWYTTEHMLIHYATNIRHLAPDAVILMEAINDLLQNADFSYFSFEAFRPDYGHFYGPVYRIIRRPSLEQKVLGGLGSMWNHKPRQVVDTNSFPGLESFERNLMALVEMAKSGGASVVLMTQPNLYKEPMSDAEEAALAMVRVEAVGQDKQWSTGTARRGMEAYNSVIRKVAAREDCLFIDLEKAIPKSLEYFGDDVHYRGPAFDLVAETVAAGLQSLIQKHKAETTERRETRRGERPLSPTGP